MCGCRTRCTTRGRSATPSSTGSASSAACKTASGRAGAERAAGGVHERPPRDASTWLGPGRDRRESVARFLETPLYLRSAANGPSPLRRQFERSLWILASIAALVLLIAGSNVANLFLARTAAREREMALRLSIGAGRGRLIQQVLVESALVAGAACVLGLLFAGGRGAGGRRHARAGRTIRCSLDLRIDWRLAAFAGGLTLLTTALFGLAPAAARVERGADDGAQDRRRTAGARAGVMRPFVAVQVAFGLVVLFVGSLLVLSFARLSSVNPGFATSDVLLLSLETVRRVDARTAARGAARRCSIGSARSRRPGGQLRRVQRARPRVDAQRSPARNSSTSRSKRRWRR